MAGKSIKIFTGILAVTAVANLWAQAGKKPKTAPAKPAATVAGTPKKVFIPGVFLGNEAFKGGPIKTSQFSDLMRQGVQSHDSLGIKYDVIKFTFNYAERRIYEDSAGIDLHMITDYLSEICIGDTLPTDISNEIYERIKPGDTIYFSNVLVTRKNAIQSIDTLLAGTFKCYFVR